LRNREVYSQLKDLLKWKKKRMYGRRWIAETAFSSIKRIFGEYDASTTRFQNMIKERLQLRYLCTTCLEELYKIDENKLRKTSYATKHLIHKKTGLVIKCNNFCRSSTN
jgi:hypothetical protein